jgi:CRP-like cAMP-binding protein
LASEQRSIRNLLLAALPPDDFAHLQPNLQLVDLSARQVFHRLTEPVTALHFIEQGWIALLAMLETGDAAEVAVIGREGMIGLPLVFGADRSIVEAMVQGAGTAFRLEARHVENALHASPSLRRMLLRFSQALVTQIAQTAACNVHHRIEQRLVCLLLLAHDRIDGDQLPMTHDGLAMMLGVRRASISTAAARLQEARIIRYGGGRISILDRAGLEAAACECYGVVTREIERLLGVAFVRYRTDAGGPRG